MSHVSIKEAAQKLGISPQTVRRRLKSGTLAGHREEKPGGFIWLVELSDEPDQEQEKTSAPTSSTSEIVASFQEQLAAKDRQIEQLHVLLRESQEQANRLLPAPEEPRKRRKWWLF